MSVIPLKRLGGIFQVTADGNSPAVLDREFRALEEASKIFCQAKQRVIFGKMPKLTFKTKKSLLILCGII
jgi:hypothetical protein